jgi:hypothetical protein
MSSAKQIDSQSAVSGYRSPRIRQWTDLGVFLAGRSCPVVLLEGIRALPDADRLQVVRLGRSLAERLPDAVFRSGNAEGSDTAFAEGVCSVDPRRMEYILTHGGMGRGRRHPAGRAFDLGQLGNVADGPVGEYTTEVSPDLKGLVAAYRLRGGEGRLGGKAACVLRDTLKVLGAPEAGLAPASIGFFYVNPVDPLSGGTGHTVRVCLGREIPVVFQSVWSAWI